MTTTNTSSQLTELATFQVGEAICGMEILQIQEINKVTQMTRVPQAPEDVLGILNLRGQIVTVIDLARRLGLVAMEPPSQARVIIVNTSGGKVGILVHRIRDVVAVDLLQKEAAPANMRGIQGRYFTGVCKQDNNLIGLLDIDRILAIQEDS
ncbi:chemotaxis protein CheW [Desulfobulbus alkaliphilus]|uniref:chemotaxis protein CheW n=1 Tax=Desulfobulbus alkaliphilus TaxID=869814 RepID=UPI001962B682|nr:chemotaxis protein CheW [Desulfobulbus alkaliphilus]MBM9536086.1 purine-binding chemotaxis protein CheW [Desulfobulbus alkaliphilus]